MPARPDAGAMVLLQSVDGDGFCVYRMVGRTIAGIARYPQPVSSLGHGADRRSEEHTSELQSLMRSSYAVFCLQKQKKKSVHTSNTSAVCIRSYAWKKKKRHQ